MGSAVMCAVDAAQPRTRFVARRGCRGGRTRHRCVHRLLLFRLRRGANRRARHVARLPHHVARRRAEAGCGASRGRRFDRRRRRLGGRDCHHRWRIGGVGRHPDVGNESSRRGRARVAAFPALAAAPPSAGSRATRCRPGANQMRRTNPDDNRRADGNGHSAARDQRRSAVDAWRVRRAASHVAQRTARCRCRHGVSWQPDAPAVGSDNFRAVSVVGHQSGRERRLDWNRAARRSRHRRGAAARRSRDAAVASRSPWRR